MGLRYFFWFPEDIFGEISFGGGGLLGNFALGFCEGCVEDRGLGNLEIFDDIWV